MCCRKEYGFPEIPEYQAGEYGSLAKCCTPVSVLKKMGEKINELSPDALFWTGDTVPYDLQDYSLEHTKRYIDYLYNYLKENVSN